MPTPQYNVASLDGEAQACEGGRPFLLTPERAFVVEQGRVDLFVVRVGDGRPVGNRTHLLRVPAGGMVPGLEPWQSEGGRGVLAVGSVGTRLIVSSRAALMGLAASTDGARLFHELVEQWVEGLCSALKAPVPPARCHEIEGGSDCTITEASTVRPRSGVVWVEQVAGRSCLLGKEELIVECGTCVPLSRSAWLEVEAQSRIRVTATHSIETAAVPGGLAALTRLMLRNVDAMAAQADHDDVERLHARTAAQMVVLHDAWGRLAELVRPRKGAGETADPPSLEREDALLAACRTAAHALGVSIKPPPHQRGMPLPRDPLSAILRASRIRSRRVALRRAWWQTDHGPLVGFIGNTSQPVALLPTPGGYVLHDPTCDGSVPITPQIATTVALFAYSLYRPFQAGSVSARQLVSFALHGCGRDILVLGIVSVAVAVLGMLPALMAGVFFNTLIPGAHRAELVQLLAVVLASACAAYLLAVAQGIAFLRIEARAATAVQAAVWDHLLRLPIGFFRPYTAGDLAVRAMSIEAIRYAISGATATTLIAGLCSLGNVALMFHYSIELAQWATGLLALVFGLTLLAIWFQLRHQGEALRHQARVSGLVLQLLSGIGKIRVAGVEASAFAQWVRRFAAQRRSQLRVRALTGWVTAFHATVPTLASVVIFSLALPLVVQQNELRTGDFLAFHVAFGSCLGATVSSCLVLVAVGNIAPLYEQVRPILCTEPETAAGGVDPGVLTGDIDVQHACFRYTPEGPVVLRDVSLRVRPGEFVALVGPSGSGKSTLLRALLGFERLESGAIYFDGQDLSGLDIEAVRRQIGVVIQNGRLMSGDIFTNIAGSSAVTLAEAWEAARMAGLDEDIEAMPMGMHTVISDGGGSLSGGQRQRLLIARAIVHRPRILLFDEATSALDNRTQAIVSASLERLQATRIVIAHRLSTIRHADRIYVLEHGTLVQSGSFDELLAHEGPFADLARRQMA